VDATEAHADAVRELQDARQELAEFESGGERRIRELEREQIVRRKVTTSDEARQKEIDLLRFDEQAGEERERLQDGIRTAEERVQDAAEGVEDAQRDVLEANKDRERQQVEAAQKITEAEREVERAALDIAAAYVDIVAEQGAASQSALIYRDALTQAEPVLRRLIDLTAFLKAVQGATPGPAPLPTREQALDIARNKVGVGAFQTGGIVPGVGPQLAVVHGGEQILTAEQQRQGAVSINQSVTFVGGEIPSVTQLDALNRKTAIRVRNLGRRP
jgi:hypothetical protein